MIKLQEIPITVKIHYKHSDYNDSGWPLARIFWNEKIISNFEANAGSIEFTLHQQQTEISILSFEHYGKNYTRDNKFIEIEKIYINNIDLDSILWDGIQYPILAPWDKDSTENISYKGNMYLGHNGYILWKFKNPLLIDIQKRLGRTVKQISGQETTREVLDDIKKYFFNPALDDR